MYQRIGAAAFKKDLTNTLALLDVLDNPHHKFKSVHVAGTNGKGSSSHMLASVLQSAGYKTGLYTSPHLKNFTERIKINGLEVTQDFVVDFVNRIRPTIEKIQPSFFEITVAMAFDYFALQHVDVAVVEVGLGGRLDSTNVITPEVSLITNISWDHMDLLGDTLPKIAIEKAGIIKSAVPVVISQRQDEVEFIFNHFAEKSNSQIRFASDSFSAIAQEDGSIEVTRDQHAQVFQLDLKGTYQKKNVLGVLATLQVLVERGFSISNESIRNGLANTIANTGLKGRWQKLDEKPLVVCDTGHNEDGITEVVQQIRAQKFEKLFIVMGVVRDKDASKILGLLPKEAYYFFCEASIPRALDAQSLRIQAEVFGLIGEAIKNVNEAIAKARTMATPNDMIFVGGSTFVVGEIENL